ncbi:phosphopantetheine-binding protein [Actinosynnema sp. NPDC047251]|uniref:Phosphopantetheine-binding-protein n=1 Tax=Saccharothrix espanaensis (strain ATCC 51144 / DSM 44229 / JCM 9112 / NBRC 15066 / NRRL 15764) TaxID=1179773 RepID=K0K4T8_SACES|nr:phosphopantetheine-binding protein [Saccharothrix espanaensis]CCH31894.1 Phosphopantetheine-binding-protein [Saccharothrix espanaensis DSM 44229]
MTGRAEGTVPEAAEAGVRQVLHEVIAEILPALDPARIGGDRHLRDLGADSVERVEIIMGVCARLRVTEPLASFGDIRDLDHLVAFLCEVGGR